MSAPFLAELERWGPNGGTASTPRLTLQEAQTYCRNLACTHYENFPIVSWLLPRRLHQHFYNIYAYCRWADDLGDEVGDPARSLELLAWWRGELDACIDGTATHPVFIALAETMQKFAIPREPFVDLVSAFEQDQRVTEYDSFTQLHDYCRRSADPVGRLVLFLCGAHTLENVTLADSVCTGLQLANFWQDVARDFGRGRVYLPREDRERFGYSRTQLEARTESPEFLKLMKFEVDRAREFLLTGLPLAERLPFRMQIDIELFTRGGLRILDRIAEIGYRVWSTRPVVTKRDFLGLFLRSLGRSTIRTVIPRSRSAAPRDLSNGANR